MSEDDPTTAPEGEQDQTRPCQACRGTGAVRSKLGGEVSVVPCPWCDGTGRFLPGHDAQARWRDEQPVAPDVD